MSNNSLFSLLNQDSPLQVLLTAVDQLATKRELPPPKFEPLDQRLQRFDEPPSRPTPHHPKRVRITPVKRETTPTPTPAPPAAAVAPTHIDPSPLLPLPTTSTTTTTSTVPTSSSTVPPSSSTVPTSSSTAPPSSSSSKLEPSLFGVEPIDEFTQEVANWLWGFCQSQDPTTVEIEAKVGILLDRQTGIRYHLPVPIETIVADDSTLRFESNMTINQHKSYNQLLNALVESRAPPSTLTRISYSHSKEIDSFHPHSQGPGKIRVTRAQRTGEIKAVVEKRRVADMNIYSPQRGFDWRISVSLEEPAALPTTPESHQRFKDRISYSHQFLQVDLTQVTTARTTSVPHSRGAGGGGGGETLHELEIEFRDTRVLLEEALKESLGEPNRYLEMIQIFLNNIRLLIRNASDP